MTEPRRFTKKPVTITAAQWFKNGDHPADYDKNVRGLEKGELREWSGMEARELGWEGQVVRYFRRPDVSGDVLCRHCSETMHVHGWIDTKEGGHIVCPGDWIITGVQGERYPCKPDIFEATYSAEVAPSRSPAPAGRIRCGMCFDTGLQNGVKCPQPGCVVAGAEPSEREALEHSPLPWTFTYFTKPDGSDIKTPQDVADTVAASALKCEGTTLWGISLDEKDDDGRTLVVCYTGNGPHSEANARLIAAAVNALNITQPVQARAAVPQAAADAEELAKRFHDTYERLAPFFGYKTREESAKPWAEVPENNRKLMIAVCASILERRWAAAVPAPAEAKFTVTGPDAEKKMWIAVRTPHGSAAFSAPEDSVRGEVLKSAMADSGATPKEG